LDPTRYLGDCGELPHSEDLELGLLTHLASNPECFCELIPVLNEQIFLNEEYRKVYRAIRIQYDSGLRASDLLDTCRQLQGNAEALLATQIIFGTKPLVQTRDTWEYYYRTLKELQERRRIIVAASEIIDIAKETKVPIDRVEFACNNIRIELQPEGILGAKSLVNDYTQYLEKIESGEIQERGIEWGFKGLDLYIDKIRPGELCLIGGRPGSGKTSIANSVVAHYCIPSMKPCLIFSLEMTALSECMRLASIVGRLSLSKLKNLKEMTSDDHRQLSEALTKIYNSKVGICDSTYNIYEMERMARDYKRENGLDLIVIDHAQLVRMDGFNDERVLLEEVGKISKIMSKDLDCAVYLLTQVSFENATPFNSTLLEAHCDQYIVVQNHDEDDCEVEIRVRKQRNGPTGTAKCEWYGPCAAFY
jgi:replicative DNA helicase